MDRGLLILVDIFACLLFVERDQPLPCQCIVILDPDRGVVGFCGFVIFVLFVKAQTKEYIAEMDRSVSLMSG